MRERWYTVAYDENSVAWLVADDHDRVALVHGMQVCVTTLAVHRPIPTSESPRKQPRRRKTAPQENIR
jgi:hypothetical protein